MKTRCQKKWRNVGSNKLHFNKKGVPEWCLSNQKSRKNQVILTRHRIAQALLTYEHLKERGRPPYCGDCLAPLTVMCVLVEASTYLAEDKHFPTLATILIDNERFSLYSC